MKALDLMKSTPNVADRAANFVTTIKRNLQKQQLDLIIVEIEKREDKIVSLLDFSLQTDLNRGVAPVTRETAEQKFGEVCSLEYELTLLRAELTEKQRIFDKYFAEDNDIDKEV